MAKITDRIAAAIETAARRYRVGKFDSTTLDAELGIVAHSPAGASINERNALGLSAVYACVYRIASTVATLDLTLHQINGRNRTTADSHPAFELIRETPNDYMTAPEFWETLTAYAVANGAGHAVIERDDRGYATAMHPVPRYEVEEIKTPNGIAYKVDGFGIVFPENLLCIYNLHRKSPITIHRENLGLAAGAQDFGSKYFQEGQATGILTTDQPLRNEQMQAIRKSWREQGNATTKLVPHGLKYQRMTISPDEAQFLGVRKYQTEEIARIFGVPPALIQAESQTTYNNVEQQNLMFGRHTIAPWTRKIEHEINRKLIQARERPTIYARFDLNSMYRGDMASRVKYYEGMVRLSAMSPNEVREREDLNPHPAGDTHFTQVNQIDLNAFAEYSKKIAGQNPEPAKPDAKPDQPQPDDQTGQNPNP